ncbi:LmeA family phospholipid-binding protein [Corynebacterium heidelbergense]|uniref:DUF2993 domain-containing protein n=1 Tax=Corynebacterium heidelbergense TaxID=2055947 RepID=A0A364VA10_9CORY|nr:DUF2993 domain-containing protein [Corynebacterium heidelbergense]RAV33492.1 DUF2993 domain-containing protein [Corynebacterium heidelbergense]WCZ35956.1 hypothetical protein CHEID_01895 [Corynebacterium heidelbergense]
MSTRVDDAPDGQREAPTHIRASRRFRQRRRWAWWKKSIVAVATLVVVLGIVDALIAARAEHNVSEQIYRNSNLPNPPKVMMAGFPYLASAFTHELQAITVTSRDVNVPGYGLLSVQSSAQYVTVPSSAVLSGEFTDAPARKVFTRLQLDGVSLGAKMGVNDLLIQNKDDISPRGGWETEALFEGTPRGYAKPATVEMTLRLKQGDVYFSAVNVISAPASPAADAPIVRADQMDAAARKRILDSFSLVLRAKDLPFHGGHPMRAYVSGGSAYVESERYYTKVSMLDLAPPTRPLSQEERPGL